MNPDMKKGTHVFHVMVKAIVLYKAVGGGREVCSCKERANSDVGKRSVCKETGVQHLLQVGAGPKAPMKGCSQVEGKSH